MMLRIGLAVGAVLWCGIGLLAVWRELWPAFFEGMEENRSHPDWREPPKWRVVAFMLGTGLVFTLLGPIAWWRPAWDEEDEDDEDDEA